MKSSVCLYSLHSTVNLPAWRPKDRCYFNVVPPSIHWDNYSRKKKCFFKITWQMLLKSKKSVRTCQHPILWHNHQNMNFSFCYFLLNSDPMKGNSRNSYDKEQKIHRNFFYICVLKEPSSKTFSYIFNKRKYLRRSGK